MIYSIRIYHLYVSVRYHQQQHPNSDPHQKLSPHTSSSSSQKHRLHIAKSIFVHINTYYTVFSHTPFSRNFVTCGVKTKLVAQGTYVNFIRTQGFHGHISTLVIMLLRNVHFTMEKQPNR